MNCEKEKDRETRAYDILKKRKERSSKNKKQ